MKAKHIMDTTSNSAVYKKAQRKYLDKYEGVCAYCPPHGGCNYWRSYNDSHRSWKKHRKTQYHQR